MSGGTNQVALEVHAQGVVLPVRAQPGARRNALRGVRAGALVVAVTQVAEKGKANASLAALLADRLGLAKSQLELLAGETSAHKRWLVGGISLDELARRIDAALATEK